MTSIRRLFCGALLLAFVVATLWMLHPYLLPALAKWLDVGQRPHRADYLMVLNGGEDTRPFAAAALVNAGIAQRVLVTEVAPSPAMAELQIPPAHEICRQVLIKRGVSAGDITVLPAAATTTYDEANALAAFLKDRPEARVLVLTDDFHTRRSRWVFVRTLADQARQVSFISAPTDDFPMDRWWLDETGFVTIVSEFCKSAFYVVCYGRFGIWLAACGLLALAAAWVQRRESAAQRPPGTNAPSRS